MKPLTQAGVRAIMLAAQGLTEPATPATKADVQAIIRRMHVLQIDTINIVARSPYLVLWSRLGDYDPRWLDQLLAEGKLFEYWSHAACFLPVEDFALYRPEMLAQLEEGSRAQRWLGQHAGVAEQVLEHVRQVGAVRSADFERTDGEKGSWWNWKAEKVALEYLFYAGELMIRERHNFQRIYDLRERIMPNWTDDHLPSQADIHDQFALHTIKALGVTKAEWIADYFRLKKAPVQAALKRLQQRGAVLTVPVEGWGHPGLAHPDHRPMVEAAADGVLPQARTTLLSPFDPIVWDRARALDLFNFDYRIECYTPAPKRQYGYFTLPVLCRNRLVGRLDPKAHRQDGIFEVKAFHLEPNVLLEDDEIEDVKAAIKACATWHKTPQVVVRYTTLPELAERLAD